MHDLYGKNNRLLIKLLQQDGQFNGQESEVAMATFSSTKQVRFHGPQNATVNLLARASPQVSHMLGGLNVHVYFLDLNMNWAPIN